MLELFPAKLFDTINVFIGSERDCLTLVLTLLVSAGSKPLRLTIVLTMLMFLLEGNLLSDPCVDPVTVPARSEAFFLTLRVDPSNVSAGSEPVCFTVVAAVLVPAVHEPAKT